MTVTKQIKDLHISYLLYPVNYGSLHFIPLAQANDTER